MNKMVKTNKRPLNTSPFLAWLVFFLRSVYIIYMFLFFKYRNPMRLLGAILQDYEPFFSLKTEIKRTQRRVDECSVGNILHNIFIFLIYLN